MRILKPGGAEVRGVEMCVAAYAAALLVLLLSVVGYVLALSLTLWGRAGSEGLLKEHYDAQLRGYMRLAIYTLAFGVMGFALFLAEPLSGLWFLAGSSLWLGVWWTYRVVVGWRRLFLGLSP